MSGFALEEEFTKDIRSLHICSLHDKFEPFNLEYCE